MNYHMKIGKIYKTEALYDNNNSLFANEEFSYKEKAEDAYQIWKIENSREAIFIKNEETFFKLGKQEVISLTFKDAVLYYSSYQGVDYEDCKFFFKPSNGFRVRNDMLNEILKFAGLPRNQKGWLDFCKFAKLDSSRLSYFDNYRE